MHTGITDLALNTLVADLALNTLYAGITGLALHTLRSDGADFERLLPRTLMHKESILSGSDNLMEMEEALFAF